MKRRDLLRYLQSKGCFLYREGAKHSLYANAGRNRFSTIPRHDEINDYLVRKICKDLGVEHGQ